MSYANPEGRISVLYPIMLTALIMVHFVWSISVLVWKLVVKDKTIMRKYDRDDDDGDDDDTGETGWRKKVRGARSVAVLKLSTVDDAQEEAAESAKTEEPAKPAEEPKAAEPVAEPAKAEEPKA